MSFGGSPGDIIIIISLARQLYRNCKTAGGEYLEVAREVASLHTVLRHLKYEIEAPESLLNRDKSKYGRQLIPIIANCDFTLQKLDELLRKYSRLGDDRPAPIWDRIRFGSAEMDTLGDIRLKLNNHKTTITVFLDTVQLHHSARISKALDGHGGQLDVILDKVDAIAERMGQKAGSMLTSYGNDDKEVWKEFRRELIAEGFSSDVLARNKDVLRAYIREIDQKGLLVEAPLTPTSASQSVSPEWLEAVIPGQPQGGTAEHDLQDEGMKEVLTNELNMKFPQSIKKDRGIPNSQDTRRDIQHGISALMINTDSNSDDRVKDSPVLRLHSAPESSDMNLERDNPNNVKSYTSSKHGSQGLNVRTRVTDANSSTEETKFLKAPDPRHLPSLQQQAKIGDRSRSSSPASIHSQASDRLKPGSYPSGEHKTAELSKTRGQLSSSPAAKISEHVSARRKGIGEEHSRSPSSSSVSLAPDSRGNPIPPEAQWTKIKRSLVSLEVLDQNGHRYEARPDFVAILGILSHQEIEELALKTKAVRESRRRHTRETHSQPSTRKPPQNFRYSRRKEGGYNDSSSEEEDSASSPEPERRHPSHHRERRGRSSHSPLGNGQSQSPHPNPSPTPNLQHSPAMWSPTSPPPNLQSPPAMWPSASLPPGWQPPMPAEVYPYYYTPTRPSNVMGPLPPANMQPMYGYPPHPPYFSQDPQAENRNHRSKRSWSSEKHQSHGQSGKKDSRGWRHNLTAAGMGGAAGSLLAVLSEAAAEF